jgi:hypothetical protein
MNMEECSLVANGGIMRMGMMKWISVKKRLPEIPEGKYGVPVIVAVFDYCYEEMNPGNGYHVGQGHYGRTKDRNGMPISSSWNCEDAPEYAFMQLHIGQKTEWGPYYDEITHWMYLPEPPMYPKVKPLMPEKVDAETLRIIKEFK